MGLLTTELFVNVSGNMAKYYEGLGYILPKKIDAKGRTTVPVNTHININVNDLPKGSRILVDVQCDNCNKIHKIRYYQYLQKVKNGKTYCSSCYSKVFNSKENSSWWKENKNIESQILNRHIDGYDDFIKKVITRDNYTCQCCNQYSGKLEVHHLNGYNWYIKGRTDDTNGITLCENCHKNFHAIYGYGNNTKEQFEEWIHKTIDNLKKYEGQLSTTRKIYCIEENKVYESAKVLAKEFGLKSTNTIYNVCNHSVYPIKTDNGQGLARHYTVKNKHLLWYDEYLSMSPKDIDEYLQNNKQKYNTKSVMCLTTNQIFESISYASFIYNIHKTSIIRCCKGKIKYCKDNFGNKLEWIYYEN